MTATANTKLFRATVVLGAALTANGCTEDKCGPNTCVPVDGQLADGSQLPSDGGVNDAPSSPGDAVVDTVAIL